MTLVTVAYGDGGGPEIMDATLQVLREAGAELTVESIQAGGRVYGMGSRNGVLPSAWPVIDRAHILLKSPTLTPESKEGEPRIIGVTEAICRRYGIEMEERIVVNMEGTSPAVEATAYANKNFALFEPLHDAQPELAGKNKASPAAMLLAAVMLLRHIGQEETAAAIHDALSQVLSLKRKRWKTDAFAEAVIESLILPQKTTNIANTGGL